MPGFSGYYQQGYGLGGSEMAEQKQSGSRAFLFLFFLVFFAVGVGVFALGILPTISEWQEMKRWMPVEARLLSADLERHTGDDSTTFKATASYHYRWHGQSYEGSQVSIHGGSDNVGSYQEDMARRLELALARGESITVWIDLNDPSRSVIDREIRWEMLAFQLLFFLLFGGVGLCGILYLLFSRSNFHPPAETSATPWLAEEQWASQGIQCNQRGSMLFWWFFALFWNLVSSPLLFAIPTELEKGNYPILIGLVFPLVGIWLLWRAIHNTLQWRRFGNVTFHMDPYPGSVGGDVGGSFELPLPYDSTHNFTATLTLVNRYESGSGKDRSTSERPKWQQQGIAVTESSQTGTRVFIRFAVPEGLPVSEPVSKNYHLWRLVVVASIPGVDFSATFELPVFATGEKSRHIRQETTNTAATLEQNYQQIEALVEMVPVGDGMEWKQPVGRNIGMAIGLLLFGGFFAGAGLFLLQKSFWFSLPFSLVGWIVVGSALYTPLNSLYVRVDGSGLYRRRSWCGIPMVSQTFPPERIAGFTVEQGVTSGQTIYYNVHLRTAEGKSWRVAEGFRGKQQAELALEAIRAAMPRSA
jgi:hypothetical protein